LNALKKVNEELDEVSRQWREAAHTTQGDHTTTPGMAFSRKLDG
jgi:hypothetical protein